MLCEVSWFVVLIDSWTVLNVCMVVVDGVLWLSCKEMGEIGKRGECGISSRIRMEGSFEFRQFHV